MTPLILILAGLGQQTRVHPQPAPSLWAAGGVPARGCLVNHTPGAGPSTSPDPSRPSLVIVHGMNPFHPLMHIALAQRYSQAIGQRLKNGMNILGWDWNGNAMPRVPRGRFHAHAIRQGRALGEALWRSQLEPESIHLVGHSSGCIVATAAARDLMARTGRPIKGLTLLDPSGADHTLLFVALQGQTAARFVEHFWAAGPSGFGKPAAMLQQNDHVFRGPAGWRGFLSLEKLDHMNLARWHISQLAANPW